MEWTTDNKGRNRLLGKSDLKSALGRSPDRFDAVCSAMPFGGPDLNAALKNQVAAKQACDVPPAQRPSPGRAWDIRRSGFRRR
jgi:hypothetical protein